MRRQTMCGFFRCTLTPVFRRKSGPTFAVNTGLRRYDAEEEIREPVGPLFAPERHDQHVAVGRQHWINRHDRGDAVKYPAVIDQRRIERLGQGEAAERSLCRVVDRGLAAGY